MQVSRKIKRSVQSGVEATWVRVNDLSISFPSRRSHRDHHVYDHECAFIKGDTLSVEEERGALLSMSGGSTVGNRGLVVPIPSFLFHFLFRLCFHLFCFLYIIYKGLLFSSPYGFTLIRL